jgi:hypothetical protein
METSEFIALPLNEQRVLVAKDVLEQIRLEKYVARRDRYMRIFSRLSYYELEFLDIKSNFDKLDYCDVCAMGACLLSITRFKNELKFMEADSGYFGNPKSKAVEMLLSVFEGKQLTLIEAAFEYVYGDSTNVGKHAGFLLEDAEKEAALKFRPSVYSDEEALIKIMQNIIDNNGTFIP